MYADCDMVLSLLWAGILRPFRALLYDPSETRGYAKNAPPRATMSRPFRPKNVKTPGSDFPVGHRHALAGFHPLRGRVPLGSGTHGKWGPTGSGTHSEVGPLRQASHGFVPPLRSKIWLLIEESTGVPSLSATAACCMAFDWSPLRRYNSASCRWLRPSLGLSSRTVR